MMADKAASVNAPIAPRFQFGDPRRRVTGQQRWGAHAMRTFGIICSALFLATVGFAGEPGVISLRFFVVSDEAVAGGHYVDTPETPKLGYIGATPDLIVHKLSAVITNGARGNLQHSGQDETNSATQVILELLPADAASFGAYTRTNVLKRVLITLGDRPLVAPFIMSPIESGQIGVRCGGSMKANELLAEVRKLVHKDPAPRPGAAASPSQPGRSAANSPQESPGSGG
jgi:hypothetical protein